MIYRPWEMLLLEKNPFFSEKISLFYKGLFFLPRLVFTSFLKVGFDTIWLLNN